MAFVDFLKVKHVCHMIQDKGKFSELISKKQGRSDKEGPEGPAPPFEILSRIAKN